jgi:hypothetical protein
MLVFRPLRVANIKIRPQFIHRFPIALWTACQCPASAQESLQITVSRAGF